MHNIVLVYFDITMLIGKTILRAFQRFLPWEDLSGPEKDREFALLVGFHFLPFPVSFLRRIAYLTASLYCLETVPHATWNSSESFWKVGTGLGSRLPSISRAAAASLKVPQPRANTKWNSAMLSHSSNRASDTGVDLLPLWIACV